MALLHVQRGLFFMVELVKIGKDSSLEQRERFLVAEGIQHAAGVFLHTCNRVECYRGQGKVANEVVLHLFRVVSGLDSAIIGETAIVNQVKTAYQKAACTQKLDKSVHKLFQTALAVGKRVRRETGISEGAMSHSQAVVDLLIKQNTDFSNLRITIIGVNKLNEKIIQFLINKGATAIFIGNRTFEKASLLAEKYQSTALRFNRLPDILKHTDVLVSATSAPHYILKSDAFAATQPITIFDLAVPRDIDPTIAELSNVQLFNIETIEQSLEHNLKARKNKVRLAEEIIQRELERFQKQMAYGTK